MRLKWLFHLGVIGFCVFLTSTVLAESQPVALKTPAPELAEINDWVNSKPLTLKDLRGQVVVLHFWTFGCINCVHNLPSYRGWQDDFATKGVTIIGVHTPEFEQEADLARIRKKVAEQKLAFPVAVDNAKATWKAFGNQFWPSIYLIDKKGIVRYRWDGELEFGGVKGDAIMREKIKELLAEPS